MIAEAEEVLRPAGGSREPPRVPASGLGLALVVFVAVGVLTQAVLAADTIGWPGPGWLASLDAWAATQSRQPETRPVWCLPLMMLLQVVMLLVLHVTAYVDLNTTFWRLVGLVSATESVSTVVPVCWRQPEALPPAGRRWHSNPLRWRCTA